MSLVGLDLNSTRARAVAGPRASALALLRLEGDRIELPLALSLEERKPIIGRPGMALVRRRPHLAVVDFFSQMGSSRSWSANGHRLDADRAVGLVLEELEKKLFRAHGIGVALPAYLGEAQVVHFRRLAERARWRLLGSLPAPVAAVLAARAEGEPVGERPGVVLVVDVDGHALTWSAVGVEADASLLSVHASPHLARGAWLRKLLDGVAGRCVRQSRRDPRESGATEQSLHDQIISAMDEAPSGALIELGVQGAGWYHHLMLHPDDLAGFVAPLAQQALAELDAVLAAAASHGPVTGLILTAPAGRLPGLAALLEEHWRALDLGIPASAPELEPDAEDFGAGLMPEDARGVRVLSADALARAAHDLAVRIHRGDVPPGHSPALYLEAPAAPEPEIGQGPPRLNFRGKDHILRGHTFSLGRDPACDLVFESALYPTVSARHAEVLYDLRSYLLCDRSRHGTLLNERMIQQQAPLHPGDWIRLGPGGPVLRFLGRAVSADDRVAGR
jgi:hypothetical protein